MTISPGLDRYTQGNVRGDLWKRPGLSPRDRSIVTLAALIARYPNVERVICGHVHRSMFVRFGGTIASAVPAPAHQVALDLRDDAPSAFMMEPPAYALHRYDPATGIVTHHAYVDAADGPYPFYEPEGALID